MLSIFGIEAALFSFFAAEEFSTFGVEGMLSIFGIEVALFSFFAAEEFSTFGVEDMFSIFGIATAPVLLFASTFTLVVSLALFSIIETPFYKL